MAVYTRAFCFISLGVSAIFSQASNRDQPVSWRTDFLSLGLLALATTAVFWFTDLDITAAKWFYHPDNTLDPWFEGDYLLWNFFYHAVPIIVGACGATAVLVLAIGSTWKRFSGFRMPATLFILTLVIGPGLLVNAIFKDHWGRPRPRQVMELGGDQHYVPPLMIGQAGKSFPAGHSSIGFSLSCFWLLWRRNRPRAAAAMLIAAIVLGGLIGAGRMAAGGHFLSDVLWSGFLTVCAAMITYHGILRLGKKPSGSTEPSAPNRPWQNLGYGMLGGGVLIGSMFSFPVHENFSFRFEPTDGAMHTLQLDIDQANITVQLTPDPGPLLDLQGTVRGFGLPINRIISHGEKPNPDDTELRYSLRQKGAYTERDTAIHAVVHTPQLQRLIVHTRKGDINVHADASLKVLPSMELISRKGKVYQPQLSAPNTK